jgi:nitrogen fixation protein NifU and related proteins
MDDDGQNAGTHIPERAASDSAGSVASFLARWGSYTLAGARLPYCKPSEKKGTALDRQAYVDHIIDHFQNPRNKGRMEDADVQLGGGNPGCGDLITMYVKIDDDDRVDAVTFEGDGCTISQAGGSIVTELAQGLTLDEVKALGLEEINEEMGEEVVKSRVRCATLALGTLQAAVDQFRRDRERREAGLPPVEVRPFEV